MSPPGGPATINGILFQLLGSLHWAASAVIRPQLTGTPEESVTLILEPSGGGGDLQIQTPNRLRIEQWKTKSDLGTWSLRDIINEVLPDLFLAVDPEQFSRNVEFVFMTEGRRGVWSEAEAVFKTCSGPVPDDDPRGGIDDSKQRMFFPDKSCTARELFDEILRVVSKRERVRDEPEELLARKLYFLLGHFELHTAQPVAEMQSRTEALLAELVDYLDDAPRKRREAVGILMETLRLGEARLTPAELMYKLNLRGGAFRSATAWSILRNTLRERLAKQTYNEGYNASFEVRHSIPTFGAKPVTVVSGDSGTGKTWRLADWAHHLANQNEVVVWVRATGNKRDTLADAAWEVWHYGLGREQPLLIDSLADRLKEGPAHDRPRVTVFVDNVQTWEEARDLCTADWSNWGFRLVVSMPSVLGQRLHEQFTSATDLAPVDDFTVPQLRDFLRRNGREWALVPADIRDTLERPILARIYCELAEGEGWNPKSEYELFSAFWRRVFTADGQVEHPGDAQILRKLALETLDERVSYPWPAAVLQSHGMTDDARRRLERIGWLRRIGPERAEIWHDRLLNWAIAEAVAELCRTNPNETEHLLSLIAEHAAHRSFRPKRRFAYTAADLLWLLTRISSPDSLKAVLILIRKMEGSHRWSTETSSLYREILPTLGPEIVPAILARATESQSADRKPELSVFAEALYASLGAASSAHGKLIDGLVQFQSPDMDRLAVLCLRKMPSSRWLNWLWQIHRQRALALHQPGAEDLAREYETSFEAMVKCLQLRPEWLLNEFATPSLKPEELSDLTFLLSHLAADLGKSIWLATKPELFNRLSSLHRRALCRCVAHFNDDTEVQRLADWSVAQEEPDINSSFAFLALCRVAPERALICLRAAGWRTVGFVRSAAMRELLLRAPVETHAALRQWIGEKPEEAWAVAELFDARPDQMDAVTLRLLLQYFERELSGLTADQTQDPRAVEWRCEKLDKFLHIEALDEFARWANSDLDRRLGRFVAGLSGKKEQFRERAELFFTMLLRFGGEGMRIAVNGWLASDQPLSGQWIDLVILNPDQETRDHLKRRAASSALTDSQPHKIPWDQAKALVLLAQLGEKRTVVETVLRWGDCVIFKQLADVCQAGGRMSDEDIQPAISALDNPNASASERENAVWALSLSGRADLVGKIWSLVSAQQILPIIVSALRAIVDLKGGHPIQIPVLRTLLRNKETSDPAAELLTELGTPEALDALEDSLQKGEPPASRHFPWNIYAVLLQDRKRRGRILQWIWEIGPTDPSRWNWPETPLVRFLPILGELGTREVEDFLWQLAFPKPSSIHHVGQAANAIRGLAKINPDEALRAAELQLAENHQDREDTIQLIMELAPIQIIPVLIESAMREKTTWSLWHIGLALRRIAQSDAVRNQLQRLLRSLSPEEQYVAAELAGWQRDEQLEDGLKVLAETNGDDHSSFAAHRAIARRARARCASEIAEVLRTATGIRQWQLADAWWKLTDPILIPNAWRATEIQDAISALPDNFVERLRNNIEGQLNDLKRKARDIDRERDRNR